MNERDVLLRTVAALQRVETDVRRAKLNALRIAQDEYGATVDDVRTALRSGTSEGGA